MRPRSCGTQSGEDARPKPQKSPRRGARRKHLAALRPALSPPPRRRAIRSAVRLASILDRGDRIGGSVHVEDRIHDLAVGDLEAYA